MIVQQVFPVTRPTTVADLYADARRARRAKRPWVVMNMISSADGAASIAGVSGGLGNDSDRAVLRQLRSIAHGVIVGAQTVRSESYSPLPPHQTLAVVSRTSNLGSRSDELFGAGNTVVVSGDVEDICASLAGDVWILEGGPTLNAQMLAAECVDEICLTISPSFVAGDVGRIVQGGSSPRSKWNLTHVALDDDFVFLRYLRP